MKKIGIQISIFMGISISFCLSLIGTLASGHFTVTGFLLSFAASAVISLLIGLIVPMRKIELGIMNSSKLGERSIVGKIMTAIVSDIIYTPLITLAMVFLAYKQAVAHGADIIFVPMFLRSLAVSLFSAFLIIFILKPLIVRFVMKKNGVEFPTRGAEKQNG